MRYAILSDIHSNWEALQKVESYLASQAIDRIAVLGDTIGYGANPNECLAWALEHASLYLMGNHEKAIHDRQLREKFTDWAREAIVWTDQALDKDLKEKIRDLSYLRIERNLTFAHGSPQQPEEFSYLTNFSDAESAFDAFDHEVCFVGHTHVPACFCLQERSASYLAPGILKLDPGKRYLFNPGSAGQPRDRDHRLSFGIYDDSKKTFEIIRLDYDASKAAAKIRKAGLPPYLADRLL